MSDYTTRATVELEVNGQRVTASLNDLNSHLKRLQTNYADAIAKGDKKMAKQLKASMKDVTKQIKQIETSTQQAHAVLKRLDTATPRELKLALKALNKELENMERGSAAWNAQRAKIVRVKEELAAVNKTLKVQESRTDTILRKFNEWQSAALAGAAAMTAVVMGGKQAVQTYADLDAEMANVRKFTGLTAEEVKNLNDEFSKMDTRTSQIDLNKLAQEAGRLGKTSEEDILGFVRAADKINVALDDLGDGATLTISKLTTIFGDEDALGTELAMLSVGSVINELSQNCSASAPYLAEFASRLGGVGSQAGMTIPQIMSYAAVLDSTNQNVEASATALSQLIVRMMQDPKRFAEATGMEFEKFNKLLNTDTNEALMMFFNRLNEIGDMNALAPVFEEMKLDGSRATAVLSALAGNVDMLRWEQEEANKAYQEATSVVKEFDVQNNTVQAGLDKARKNFTAMAVDLGEKLMPVVRHLISGTSALMKVMSSLIDFIIKYKGTIITTTAAVVAYNVAVKISSINIKELTAVKAADRAITVSWRATTLLGSAAMSLLTGNVKKATSAFRAFSKVVRLSPKGLAIAGVTALVGALGSLVVKTVKARDEAEALEREYRQWKDSLTDLSEKTSDVTAQEIAQLRLLYDAAIDESMSKDKRRDAASKLISQYPDYFKNLTAEQIMVGKAKEQYDNLTTAIINAGRARAAEEKIYENQKELLALEDEHSNLVARQESAQSSYVAAVNAQREAEAEHRPAVNSAALGDSREMNLRSTQTHVSALNEAGENLRHARELLDAANNALTRNEQKQQDIMDANAELAKKFEIASTSFNPHVDATIPVDDYTTPTASSSPATTDALSQWREKEEALNRIAYATGEKSYRDYTARIIAIDVEFYQRKMAQADLSESERLTAEAQYHEALKKQNESATAITLEDERNAYNERLATAKQYFLDGQYSTATYNEAIERIEAEHLATMVTLTKEGTKERIDAEKALKEHEFNSAQRKAQDQERLQSQLRSQYFNNDADSYSAAMAALDVVYNQELLAAQNNADEKLRIEEAYLLAKAALQEKYNVETVDENRNALEKANSELAEWLESDAGQAVTQSFDTIMSGMSSIFSQVSSIVQSELEMEMAAIDKRYEAEISRAEGNTALIARLEAQKQEELAEAKNEANRKMFAMQVIQAVAQTAMGALNAYSSASAIPVVGWVMGPIAAAMAVAAGMLQVAAIKKQQQASEAQGYAQGGFTPPGGIYEPVGVVHAGEWVASQKLLSNPVARPLINALDYAQRNNTYGHLSATPQATSTPQDDATAVVLVSLVKTVEKLQARLDTPFVTVNTVTGDVGIKKAQDDYQKLIKNKTPKSAR